ncbi:hypothetical protein JCM3766R1_002685 [Sporobolomyces carnicolor]
MAPQPSLLPVRKLKASALPRLKPIPGPTNNRVASPPRPRERTPPLAAPDLSILDFHNLLSGRAGEDDFDLLNDESVPDFLVDQSMWTVGGRTPARRGKDCAIPEEVPEELEQSEQFGRYELEDDKGGEEMDCTPGPETERDGKEETREARQSEAEESLRRDDSIEEHVERDELGSDGNLADIQEESEPAEDFEEHQTASVETKTTGGGVSDAEAHPFPTTAVEECPAERSVVESPDSRGGDVFRLEIEEEEDVMEDPSNSTADNSNESLDGLEMETQVPVRFADEEEATSNDDAPPREAEHLSECHSLVSVGEESCPAKTEPAPFAESSTVSHQPPSEVETPPSPVRNTDLATTDPPTVPEQRTRPRHVFASTLWRIRLIDADSQFLASR